MRAPVDVGGVLMDDLAGVSGDIDLLSAPAAALESGPATLAVAASDSSASLDTGVAGLSDRLSVAATTDIGEGSSIQGGNGVAVGSTHGTSPYPDEDVTPRVRAAPVPGSPEAG